LPLRATPTARSRGGLLECYGPRKSGAAIGRRRHDRRQHDVGHRHHDVTSKGADIWGTSDQFRFAGAN
jgi:hypothetical protein